MAPTTPDGEPTELVAGDSWRWRISDVTDYPQSEGWALKYELLGDSKLSITPTYQTSGDDDQHWLVAEATTDTEDITPGDYQLFARMVGSGTYNGREETILQVNVKVLQDPRTAGTGDYQSHWERRKLVVEAALEGRLTKDMESYSIAGRSITKISYRELERILATCEAMLHMQRTGKLGRDVKVTFGSPT